MGAWVWRGWEGGGQRVLRPVGALWDSAASSAFRKAEPQGRKSTYLSVLFAWEGGVQSNQRERQGLVIFVCVCPHGECTILSFLWVIYRNEPFEFLSRKCMKV